jgi:hypothetical protein
MKYDRVGFDIDGVFIGTSIFIHEKMKTERGIDFNYNGRLMFNAPIVINAFRKGVFGDGPIYYDALLVAEFCATHKIHLDFITGRHKNICVGLGNRISERYPDLKFDIRCFHEPNYNPNVKVTKEKYFRENGYLYWLYVDDDWRLVRKHSMFEVKHMLWVDRQGAIEGYGRPADPIPTINDLTECIKLLEAFRAKKINVPSAQTILDQQKR